MRGNLVLLHLVVAAAALLFIVLALIYIVLAAGAAWAHEIGAAAAMFMIGACIGCVAVLVLIGLGSSVTRWRRQDQAERGLPRATVVSR